MFFAGRRLISSKLPKAIVFFKNSRATMNNSEDIADLTERLTKAEKRLEILTKEIKDIKSKISAIHKSTNPFAGILRRLPPVAQPFSTTSGPRTEPPVAQFSTTSVPRTEGPPEKRAKPDFDVTDDYVNVFTDGACENNGKLGAKAGIGVWFGEGHHLNVSAPVVGKATNNVAEIQACNKAIEVAYLNGIENLRITTDSQFVINAMTNWIKKWKKNNWKLATGGAVKNKEAFIELDNSCQKLKDIQWVHVYGHTGIRGNEEADKLAREGASRYKDQAGNDC